MITQDFFVILYHLLRDRHRLREIADVIPVFHALTLKVLHFVPILLTRVSIHVHLATATATAALSTRGPFEIPDLLG